MFQRLRKSQPAFVAVILLTSLALVWFRHQQQAITDANTQLVTKKLLHHRYLVNARPSQRPPNDIQQVKAWHLSVIFPFISQPASSQPPQAISTTPIAQAAAGATLPAKQIVVYGNLANYLTPGTTTSRFICPDSTPFAIAYTVISNQATISLATYRNACAFDGGGHDFNDILYGSDQHIDDSGNAATMTAFIPQNVSEGCTNSVTAINLMIKPDPMSNQVSPITINLAGQTQIIGYQQQYTAKINCNQICTQLLQTYCQQLGANYGYCSEQISASYQINSTYQARQIKENFCACSISGNSAQGSWTFTNAVDIESLINYNMPLASVTCSNYPIAD